VARGFWDGLHVELDGGGEAISPSATLALREAVRLAGARAD
jgi:hypothetical protein